ncbi:hypothetical protein GGS21DRAFT_493727 [Xylaria nigripes]|nr:hypothetical protein GGS21DRAFT_493727 [Xylaria nigripes]
MPSFLEQKMEVDHCNDESLQLKSWSSRLPQTYNNCIHQMFQDRARAQPDVMAICSWDGQFTYAELDALSTSFAVHLTQHGVGPEVYVPICSEKSSWVPVAMLAVLKAGGAFVLLDPSHPIARLEEMCRTVGATKVVASKQNVNIASRLAPEIFITCAHTPYQTSRLTVDVHHGNAAYAIFTSGSSGRPKAVTIEHRAFCSSAMAHAAAINLNATSRVLQFASYAFDACLTEILTALIVGACVCIPSEEGRASNLVGEAHRLQPNWALLTPSVARILDVADFPMLQTLILGGEAINSKDVQKWAPHLSLYVAYGVSEAAVVNLARPCSVADVDHANLGFGVGVACWVVDPDNHDQLAALGIVGELVLDGPAVGREYIGDPARTGEAFIDPPAWYLRPNPDAISGKVRHKLYKTGDLCTYNPDGSLRYVGRKDDQKKLRGQRLEVAEVEHHLRLLLLDAHQIVVDVVKINELETLVAFILPDTQPISHHVYPDEFWLLEPNEGFHARTKMVQQQLHGIIPEWMIPSIFLYLKYMPTMPSGKSDRRSLLSLTARMTQNQLQSYGAMPMLTVKRAPFTSMERTLQQLWASILAVPVNDIGLDDNFMEFGGTSIHAMKLAGAARRLGLALTVGDVFRHGSLADMALSLKHVSTDALLAIIPFSLIPKSEDRDRLISQIMQICRLRDRRDIEDVYPCTPLQEGLISLTSRRPGAYTAAFDYELPSGLDIHRFKQAWDTVVDANPIIRTRFIRSTTNTIYQVILRGAIPWESETNSNLASGKMMAWDDEQMGRPLVQFSLRQADFPGCQYIFHFALHHALSDGWAMPLLLQQVQAAYDGDTFLPVRPFNRFIDYISREKKDYVAFWNRYFSDLQAATFPAMPSANYTPNPTAKSTFTIQVDSIGMNEYSVPNRLKLAWGILISLYTGNPDTIFGITVNGRGAPVLGIEDMTGPTIASIPYRLYLRPDESIFDHLQKVHDDSVALIPFEQAGLQYISRMGPESASACSAFQSLLVIQPHRDDAPLLFSNSKDRTAIDAFSTYVINLICQQLPGSIEIDVTFDPKVVEETQLSRMINQLRHIFQQLDPSQSGRVIRDLDTTSPEDWAELTQWNKSLPEPVHTCAHDLIRKQCELRPNSPAIFAWDGGFTYAEVDNLSSSLAAYLMERGVGPEVFVPLCFEKTRWATIAMLGVIKAGGAFVLLDPSHPAQRLRGICRGAGAQFVLSSEKNVGLASKIATCTVIIGIDWKPCEVTKTLSYVSNPAVSPENSIYAVFTSGSTGIPKGAIHSHISWCTSAQANLLSLYLEPESRVFQFAAYAFDVSIADNLLTLVAGGCVCVPKTEDIHGGNLVQAINDLGANWACLTSSVARIIDPQKVPKLKTLLLGGEPISSYVISLWLPYARLLNVYGPAECAILTTLHRNVRDLRNLNNVGFPTSAVCWVVDVQNEHRLAPIGTVGELLVESPIVGHGYLNDPERSAESFISAEKYPKWLSKFRPGGTCRLYRTGDLVQYTKDGSLSYVSRSGTQIKLRGQRIELGEVEYQLLRCFPEVEQVVAEVIVRNKGAGGPALAAFILPKLHIFKMSDQRFYTLAAETTRQLELLLPTYMVPTIFIPVHQFPYSRSGKLDRKLLRTKAAQLHLDEYVKPAKPRKGKPVSAEESVLLELFSHSLKVPIDELNTMEHFVRLGGDSIVAMHLVALAKDRGLMLSTADIFENPTISSLAKRAQKYTNGTEHRLQPLSLLHNDMNRRQIETDAMNQCGIHQDNIQDIYPCTPLQEGCMSLSVKTPGMYIGRFRYNLPQETDLARFQSAWNQVLESNSILRTRMIESGNSGVFQIVLKDLPSWHAFDTIEGQESHSYAQVMALGSQLVYLSLAPMSNESGSYRFLLTVHHSLYDGWSLDLLWQQALKAYHGQALSPQLFNRFIRHVIHIDGPDEFWKAQMRDLNAVQFPALPHVDYSPVPSQSLCHSVADLPIYKGDHTLSTMVQFAWALVVSHYTDSADVVFGLVSNGRSTAVEGIAEMTGPTIATFPVRVLLDMDKTVEDSLTHLQQRSLATIPFTHTGLHNIRRINCDTSQACSFQSQIVLQPPSITSGMNLEGFAEAEEERIEDYKGFASYAFVMVCHMQEGSNNLHVLVNYDSYVIQQEEAQRMVEQFHGVLRQVVELQNRPIREIEIISKEDSAQLATWNAQLSCGTFKTLQDLVLRNCRERPNAEAVSSWDGMLTYSQLDDSSARLAQHLLTFGLLKESKIVVCLEKSCWSIVVFLAVLRSGCACVVVDPGHPRDRIEEIIERAVPELMIVSATHQQLVQGLVAREIHISSDFICSLPLLAIHLPTVLPNQVAFILFTSGSTGAPKGIVMEHVNLSTSLSCAGAVMRYGPETRALHFSSYAFDASIYEIFTTLACGGCLCVVSEHDRMNNLIAVIRNERINTAAMTPSTLALLEPEDVPSIKSLVLAGEILTSKLVKRWADKVRLMNGYGPAESAVCCSLHQISSTEERLGTIGRIMGGRGWIVDRSNHNKLAAVGAVGELIIEGPQVTRGYLNEPEKTAASYIKPPHWLLEFGSPGTNGRLYKTGDLVQYNADGSLRFIGRKGSQVKLRGQRIELGEVEYHLKKFFPIAAEVVAEVITPDGGRAPFLVAAVLMGQQSIDDAGSLFYEPTISFREISQKAKDGVSNFIPSYMIPYVYLPLRRLPLSRNLKLDRRKLRDACSSLSLSQIQEYSVEAKVAKRAPSTDIERTLQQIWARVLNIEASSIGVDDNWIRLGGDSIQAMRVVAQCAAAGMKTSVMALFHGKTIAQMSLRTEYVHSTPARAAERENVLFDLSPIQQIFFDKSGSHHNHCNQSLSFRLSKPVSSEVVQKAIWWIVSNHSMFRARFTRNSKGQWKQMIITEMDQSYWYQESMVLNRDEAASLVQSDQESLNIQHGPLFICRFLIVGQENQPYLSFTAHRLIIDNVSWQIVLSDIEVLLTGQRLPVPPSLSFQTWTQLQAKQAAKSLHSDQAPRNDLLSVPKDYWQFDTQTDIWGDVIDDGFVLSEQETQVLLEYANHAFRTRPVEILHAVLLQAFANVFTDRPVPEFFIEGRDREPWDPNLDPARTVGWFTTLCSVYVSVQPADSLMDIVRKTKDTRRQLERKGWASFPSCYQYPDCSAQFRADRPLEILFNYHPGFTKDRASVLQPHASTSGKMGQIAPHIFLIDILAEVRDSRLSFKFTYNRHMRHHQLSIRDWIEQAKHSFESASVLLAQQEPSFTASDFPRLNYSYSDLEVFNKNIGIPLMVGLLEIEDAYKCSSVQDGMLLSQAKVPELYLDRFVWSVRSRSGSQVNPEKLQGAWQQVLQKHPLLRTVFYENPGGNGHYDQLVLKWPLHNMSIVLPPSEDPVQQLERHEFDISHLSPPHRLAICASITGDVECLLEANHAILDGYSRQLILRDLSLAYENKLDLIMPQRTYGDYVEYINARPVDESMAYWERYLRSAESCILPPSPPCPLLDETKDAMKALSFALPFSPALRSFSLQHELTLANIFQLAWALVLRCYVNSESTCFGYMTSGRDIPIAGIDDTVGPIINMHICNIAFGAGDSVLDLLKRNQDDYIQSLTHQHISITDKMKAAKFSASTLFNTLMSVQSENASAYGSSALLFGDFRGANLTEYDICLNIGVLENDIDISWEYTQTFISDEQVENISGTFQQALLGIISRPQETVNNINLLGNFCKDRIGKYNERIPQPADELVDVLIEKQCLVQPLAQAINAWDGNFTYAEVNNLSDLISDELKCRGIGPNQFVPLCFEKSRWTMVAALGVLKTGGAFILLETSHPVERLQDICRLAGTSIVLSSESKITLAAQLVPQVLPIDEQVVNWKNTGSSLQSYVRDIEDTACVIFTSGSTGKPKGVMIPHRALASSIMSYGNAFLMDTSSRVFQFASYAFDAAVWEHLSTMAMGGCICIPSDSQRQDIARSIATFQANWTIFTPAVARVLDPSDLKTLRTLILVGESTLEKELNAWRSNVNLLLSYGPSECTVVTSAQMVTKDITDGRTIGRCLGSRAWIVNPNDADQLLPIGAVGELLIEGPNVGLGYLNDPEKTAEAFIELPRWLAEFQQIPTSRMYKTGDLVRYIDNGVLQFFGRKDLQVKIRGNRIELGEVESRLYASFPGVLESAVEIIRPTDGRQPMIVAFVCMEYSDSKLQEPESHTSEDLFKPPSLEFSTRAQNAEANMSKYLPTYMMPVVYLPIRYMPLTRSRKLDRKLLREMTALLTPQQLEQYDFLSKTNEVTMTTDEILLQQVWARILNKDPSSIGLHSNFFRLGGDSISAMQVVAQCKATGISLTMADIFRYKSISQLSAILKKSSAYSYPPERINIPFELSPTQRLYFEVAPRGDHHFNVSSFLRIARPTSGELLHDAIHALIKRHSMLRARFSLSQDGEWRQTITSNVSGSYRYKEHIIQSFDSAGPILSDSELTINAHSGPLLVADLINVAGSEQYLFIAGHHLVTDLVSWRIILSELETYLTHSSMPGTTPFSFQIWCTLEKEYAVANLDPEFSRLDTHLPQPPEDYWGLTGRSNLKKDTNYTEFTLSQKATTVLMEAINYALQAKPVELFQAALIHSFAQTFRDRSPPSLWNEGHGREPWTSHIDLSGTVGWFTTMWPLSVAIEGCNIFDTIIRTKDRLRAVPSNGWAHFTSSLHPKAQEYTNFGRFKEVTFNFAGLYQQFERSDALFQMATRPRTRIDDISENLGRFSVIDVVGQLSNGCLSFNFIYNKHAAANRPILEWITNCERSLMELADKLPSKPAAFTLADFPLLPFSYETLEKFTRSLEEHDVSISNVESAYPCSPIQRGMLLSQAKVADHYQTHIIWRMTAMECSSIDMIQLMTAWRRVVARHTILRTVFVASVFRDNFVDQVVLKSVSPEVVVIPSDEESSLIARFSQQRQPIVGYGRLPHRLTIAQTSTGDVLCGLELSHALSDATTNQNILNELRSAYQATLPSYAGPAYYDYIAYLGEQSITLQNEYWTNYLKGVIPCHFPAIYDNEVECTADAPQFLDIDVGDISMFRQFCEENDFTLSNIFQVAWGILLKSYINSDSVCFGYLSQGRDVPIPHVQDAMGPFINLLLCKMELSNSTPLMKALRCNQNSYIDSLKHQHYSLTDILHASQVPSGESLFNTVISLQNVKSVDTDQSSVRLEVIGGKDPSEYDIVVHIMVGTERVNITLVYLESFMCHKIASNVADSLSKIIHEIIKKPDASIATIEVVGERSRQLLLKWSGILPLPSADLVHDLIHQRCLAQPDAPAVDAWDGPFSYLQVDELSSKLAFHLSQYVLGPDTFILVCFEKSRWTPVVMLAVLKSGAAIVLLDPSQPSQRLESMCRTAKSSLAIASEEQTALATILARHVITVGDHRHEWMDAGSSKTPSVSPDHIAYAIFTSGSTGQPKGIQVSHSSFITSAREHSVALGMTRYSRVLQFSSYSFDVCMAESLTTLLVGGCICIPSDKERKESLAEAVARMRANLFLVTPAMARVLDPSKFPSLETVILTGDLITEKEVSLWRDRVDLRLCYGPTECAVFSSATRRVTAKTSGRNIGVPVNCRSWVVDPNDHERLLPVGAIGELLIEGPTVAKGYLNEPVKTAAVFIEQPTWLKAFSKTPSPVYKTGDLVKYSPDGTTHFISRKDTQIKIRGQRLELSEVEYQVRACYPRSADAVAELVTTKDQSRGPFLVAFIYVTTTEPPGSEEILARPCSEFHSEVQQTEINLNQRLPSYMIPSLYLPLQRMPLNSSGKIDRDVLRKLVAMLSQDDISTYSAPAVMKTQPINEAEQHFQQLFAKMFDVNADTIGREDNWFRLGGDSILAMALIPMAREAGYSINMVDIFNNPKLADLASSSVPTTTSAHSTIAPFSLMSDKATKETLIELASAQCDVPASHIEDVYPATSLQEGLVALSAKRPGHYIASFQYQIAEDIDIERFIVAWNATAAAHAILRTRIIQSDSFGFLQIVMHDLVDWQNFNDEHACDAYIEATSMGLGNQLVYFALIRPRDRAGEGYKFRLTLHHALYDGGSLPRLLSQVQSAYHGQSLAPSPFNRFIQYVVNVEGSEAFWKSEFDEFNAPIFPTLPSSNYIPDPSTSLTHTMSAIGHQFGDYTTSSAISLAWAIVMSCYTDSQEILYGMTVNGRSCPVEGIEEVTGPTFATFPVRTHLNQNHTVRDSLASIQSKTAAVMPFQQFGMQNMRALSPDAARACSFQCHLAIQVPINSVDNGLLADGLAKQDYGAFSNYAFVIICHLPAVGETDIAVAVSYDRNIVEPLQATRMVRQFEHVLRQIELSERDPESQSIQLRDIELVCPEDKQELATWNSVVPPSYDACLHELVLQHAVDRPNAHAICAWDGDMTFKDLDNASAILSQQLQSYGIQAGSRVPLLFDRSKWLVVAMIAIHRLGGTCVNIDPTHPKGRIQDILDRTQAKVALASSTHGESLAFENTRLVTVPIQGQQPRAEDFLPLRVRPNDVAFVIFTSGSTGKPKGILMEHANLATSIRGYSAEAHLDQDSRGLHFASYAFDAAIYEIFGVLLNGGCICIPNEVDRMNDVTSFVSKNNVNWALFTPSYMTLLHPESVPSLRTIFLGGEAISIENVRTWASRVNLVSAYGPAEATICAVDPISASDWKQGTLGHVTGGVGWVTMPSDPSRLAPIGTPGELAIEGAVVARGYLGDPDKTSATFVTNPHWLRPFRQGHSESRVYYSGDLVQYNTDGTIRYLGRADTQVKLRGQRIELGEVEYHVRHAFPNAIDVVSEVVTLNGTTPTLIAFVASKIGSPTYATNNLFYEPTEEFLAQSEAATRKLANFLPSFMMPSLFVQLPEIPRTSSDKSNRRLLREQAAKLSKEEIQALSNRPVVKRKPTTEQEVILQSLWAQILKISQNDIGVDDNFLNVGDSFAAIRLSGFARKQGLNLPVSQIFRHPILSEQARIMTMLAPAVSTEEYRPGSLLGITNIATFFDQYLSKEMLSYQSHDVEDILPTTELQSSLLGGKNVTYSRLQMNTQVDPIRLVEACRAVVRKHGILRTVFVPYGGEILQVVLRQASFNMIQLECDEDPLEYSEKWYTKNSTPTVPFGSLHFQPTLISRSQSDHVLALRMTHAQYDAVSFPIITKDLTSAYSGTTLTSNAPPFAHFLRYRLSQNSREVHQFWRRYLGESEMTRLEMLPQAHVQPEFIVKPLRKVPLPTPPEGITMASLVKAAWAVVLARNTKRKDVVFGHIINGRDAPLVNIDAISGPCITMSPFRVSMQAGWTIRDLLDHVQNQYTRSMPYANLDFQSILKNATSWPPETNFGSVVTHQDRNVDLTGSMSDATRSRWKNIDFGIQPHFHVVTFPNSGRLWVQLVVSSHKMHPSDAELLMGQFCELMAQFSEDVSQPLRLALD